MRATFWWSSPPEPSEIQWSVVADDETFEIELALVTPDAAAPAVRTTSIVLAPSQAIAAGEAYVEQAAALAQAEFPPLPFEPAPVSRHAKRFAERAARPEGFAYESYLKPLPGHPAPEGLLPELVYGVTLRLVNLGDSRTVRARKHLDSRIAARLGDGARFVPVISRQGGVGATTVTTLLGMALADVRDDRVLAVDANRDRPVLAERVDEQNPLEVARAYAPVDDDVALVLTDGATGVLDPTMNAALRRADGVVLVTGGTSEQARVASETVSWMEQNDLGDLAENAVVAINTATPGTRYESLDAIEAHFQARVRDVVRIPYDEELVAGTPVRYGALRPDTRAAARDLAAKVMDALPPERAA
jgi:MinD-like ATPase involved in chromosome partitioning or flagellar assembly